LNKYFELFNAWITGGISIELLNKLNGLGTTDRTLRNYCHAFLNHPPKHKKLSYPKHINLKVDAKYFGQFGCTIVFKERTNIIYWEFAERETLQIYINAFNRLTELGYIVDSVTSDKHGSLLASVRQLFPDIPHQYCLVHIQRRCETLLTKNPETEAGRQLLELVQVINQTKTHSEKRVMLAWIARYEERWDTFLKERTYSSDPNSTKKWWHTHKNLRTAFTALKSSQNNIYYYLDNPNIPKDTDGLEAEFTHLKNKLNAHRGLSRKRLINFVDWYWVFKSKK